MVTSEEMGRFRHLHLRVASRQVENIERLRQHPLFHGMATIDSEKSCQSVTRTNNCTILTQGSNIPLFRRYH